MTEKSTFSLAKEKVQSILSIVNEFLESKIKADNFVLEIVEDIFCSFDLISPLGNNIADLIYQLINPCGLYLNPNDILFMSEIDLRENIRQTLVELEKALKVIPGFYMSYVIFDEHRDFIL